ncbi:MAG TPA: AMP-binding protein, partial [Thermoanaerobaculia bacterium]
MSAAAEGFRLSAQQRRLWRLGASPAFCAQAVLRLEGNLDRDALRRAAQQAVERHEALRTRFVQPPGFLVPLQIIAPAGTLIWSEGDEEAIAAQRELARDPEAGAMVRFHLVPRGSGHLLVLTANPLAVDGRSLVLLSREIARFYAGEPAEDEPLQFADFVEWEAQLLEEEEGRAFWRKRVSAGNGDTLPFERRGSGAPFAVLRQAVPLPPGDLDRVGADPAVFLLACWRELLARFDRRESLAVSVLSDGRAFDDLAGAVGLYARYLPLPGALSPETSPRRAARQLGEALREALEWQCHFAWEVWEEELRSPGSPGLAFEHQRLPAAWEAGGVTFAVESLRVCQDRFRIKLAWLEGPGGGSLEIQADAGLFEPDDVASLAGQLAVLLRSAAGQPEAPLSSLDALPENERLRVARFAVDRPAAPAPVPVHHRVEERAAVAPDAPAVVSESELLTYGELNARANRLAHWLRRAGVGPDVPVALWLERSAEVVVALLAVLKAGGAYLPLDPGQPRQRLGFLLEDARPPLLLTRGPLPVGFP